MDNIIKNSKTCNKCNNEKSLEEFHNILFFGKSYAFRLGYEKKFLLRLIIIYLSLFVNVFFDGFW